MAKVKAQVTVGKARVFPCHLARLMGDHHAARKECVDMRRAPRAAGEATEKGLRKSLR